MRAAVPPGRATSTMADFTSARCSGRMATTGPSRTGNSRSSRSDSTSSGFCSHCGSGNRGDGDRCSACGGPRYGQADEDHPDFAGDHRGKAKREPWEDSLDMHQEHAREAMSVARLSGPPEIPPAPLGLVGRLPGPAGPG